MLPKFILSLLNIKSFLSTSESPTLQPVINEVPSATSSSNSVPEISQVLSLLIGKDQEVKSIDESLIIPDKQIYIEFLVDFKDQLTFDKYSTYLNSKNNEMLYLNEFKLTKKENKFIPSNGTKCRDFKFEFDKNLTNSSKGNDQTKQVFSFMTKPDGEKKDYLFNFISDEKNKNKGFQIILTLKDKDGKNPIELKTIIFKLNDSKNGLEVINNGTNNQVNSTTPFYKNWKILVPGLLILLLVIGIIGYFFIFKEDSDLD